MNGKIIKKFINSTIYVTAILVLTNNSLIACTFFMATHNGKTFFGNNEDMIYSDTNIWFHPAEEGKYGRVYFGFNNGWPQGGMNDQGLCFDGASTPKISITFSPEKKPFNGNLIARIMEECATVEEVLTMVNTYKFFALGMQGQLLFVDKTGASAIVGGKNENGDIDIIKKEGDHQVLTNFFPSNPDLGGYPCERYKTASEMLERNNETTVENFRSILNAVHVEGRSATVYSNIFDLQTGVMYIYYFHNFSEVVKLDLNEELKKGAHSYRIRSLFKHISTVALQRFDRNKKSVKISKNLPEFLEYRHPVEEDRQEPEEAHAGFMLSVILLLILLSACFVPRFDRYNFKLRKLENNHAVKR